MRRNFSVIQHERALLTKYRLLMLDKALKFVLYRFILLFYSTLNIINTQNRLNLIRHFKCVRTQTFLQANHRRRRSAAQLYDVFFFFFFFSRKMADCNQSFMTYIARPK